MPGAVFYDLHLHRGTVRKHFSGSESFIQTASTMVRVSFLKECHRRFHDLFSFKFFIGDSTMWLGLASISDVYFLPDQVSVYRIHAGGVCRRNLGAVMRDGYLVRMYYLLKLQSNDFVHKLWFAKCITAVIVDTQNNMTADKQIENFRRMSQDRYFVWLSSSWHSWVVMTYWKHGWLTPRFQRLLHIFRHFNEDTLHRIYLCAKGKICRLMSAGG